MDTELFAIDREIDWLDRVSPIDNASRWKVFRQRSFAVCPPLTYRPLNLDTAAILERLDRLTLDDVEEPNLHILLNEKAIELERQVRLLQARDTPAFTTASVGLFGGTDPTLVADAVEILESVPERSPSGPRVDAQAVERDAMAARTRYATVAPDLHFDIRLVDDSDAKLLVHHGDLLIDRDLVLPRSRVRPLIAHEVGVHVLTRYNGRRQPLTLLQSGLAHYDALQEGLATFCEYLEGCLPPSRLRVLAARVVAVDMAVRHEPIEAVFDVLHHDHKIPAEPAFEVAVRAKRGGGLTKDAVYLAGLRDLLAWLKAGGDISQLFLGKYALQNHHLVEELLDQGLLLPAAVIPSCVTGAAGRRRIAEAVGRPLSQLHQIECTS